MTSDFHLQLGLLGSTRVITIHVAFLGYGCRMDQATITVDSQIMGGVPCVRGLRIPVATVVAMIADGMSADEVIDELPDLTADDIAAALHYAADAVRERQLPLRPSA